MIGSTRQIAVYAYDAPADLRKGFDGLTALVTQGLRRDPLSGDLYVFANRTRKRAKVLLWCHRTPKSGHRGTLHNRPLEVAGRQYRLVAPVCSSPF